MAYADAGMRATSLMVSAVLLTGLLAAAMTMRFAMAPSEAPISIGAIEIVRPPAEEPPPQRAERTPPPPIAPMEEAITVFENPAPIDVSAPPTEIHFYGPPQPQEVTNPSWNRRPRDLSRFYPARARQAGIEGEAVLDCMISVQGALNCSVASETPQGWGFGEAAQRIAREHRMVPATREGQPVEARYRMRLPFKLD